MRDYLGDLDTIEPTRDHFGLLGRAAVNLIGSSVGLFRDPALRQAPKVILVGEMRDRETIEIAMEAAETGHLVLSTLHTIDAAKTIERIVGSFPLSDQQAIRTRFSKAFRFVISQRLLPKKDGNGRVAVL